MHNQLTCDQVSALMSFYLEDKLSAKLSEFVRKHLESCPECMEKYLQMKNMMTKFIDIQNEELENPYITKQYEDFKSNLSAYIDNELDDTDSIKIKKIAISNPLARQDLENIYTFKKLLHDSFEKTKNDLRYDYSKSIISRVQEEIPQDTKIDPFVKITTIFFIMISFIVAGIIYILYF